MDAIGAEFSNRTKDIFLAEPLSVDGRKALDRLKVDMTEDELYGTVYVEPFTEFLKKNKEAVLEDTDLSNLQDDAVEIGKLPYYVLKEMQDLVNKEKSFVWRLSSSSESTFIIKGVAGCGKSTYLHKIERLLSDSTNFHIYDFEKKKQTIAFMSSKIDLKNLYENNIYKCISIILNHIYDHIGMKGKNVQEHLTHIKNIVNVYYSRLNVTEDMMKYTQLVRPNLDIDEQVELFAIMQEYANDNINYSSLSKALTSIFKNRFFSSETSDKSDLAYVAGFLIRLYYCLSVINNRKQLFVIDNIESFIDDDGTKPINECDIEAIIEGCVDATKNAREILLPLQEMSDYFPFYAFLFVTRETTASTVKYLDSHRDSKPENVIDISSWFCSEDIYNNKRAFLKNKGVNYEKDCYEIAYEHILSDISSYQWGLSGIISKMYKNSHRRAVECVPDALARIRRCDIEHFNSLWQRVKNEDSKKRVNQELKSICRKYILHLLLDHIHQRRFFESIKIETLSYGDNEQSLEEVLRITNATTPHHHDSSSLARKIVTVLHRFALVHSEEKYVSFQRLIDSILKLPYLPTTPNRTQVYELGEILYRISNDSRINRSRTNWTSLVCLRYSDKEEYSEQRLCEILWEQWNYYRSNNIELDCTTDYGVRITKAGSFFLKILPDFEYFACRYLPREAPIFSKESVRSIILNGKKTYRAIIIMEIVKGRAFKCIEKIINRDKSFFVSTISTGRNNKRINISAMCDGPYSWVYQEVISAKPLVHPYRIISQHIGYIGNYITYIESMPNDVFEERRDKAELIKKAAKIRQSYREYYEKLRIKHPDYFAYN